MNDPQPEGHMASDIERRKFLATLGGTVVAWPLVARAQQAAMPVVGFVSAGSTDAPLAAAFRKGLNEGGFVQGQNVTAQYHWLAGQHPYKNRGKPRRNGRACGRQYLRSAICATRSKPPASGL